MPLSPLESPILHQDPHVSLSTVQDIHTVVSQSAGLTEIFLWLVHFYQNAILLQAAEQATKLRIWKSLGLYACLSWGKLPVPQDRYGLR